MPKKDRFLTLLRPEDSGDEFTCSQNGRLGAAISRFGPATTNPTGQVSSVKLGNLDLELAVTYRGRWRLMTRTLVLGHIPICGIFKQILAS